MNFKRIEFRLILFWFGGTFLATSHYLITKPLFDFSIVPTHVASAYIYPAFLFFPLGVKFALLIINKLPGKEGMKFGFFLLLFIVMVFGLVQESKDFNNNQWTRYGKTMDAGTMAVYQVGDWMLKNTDNKDVFLANDESAFMLNGMSGRKVVFTRRVHASAYVDMEQRYADGIMMLYCNDSNTINKLIEKYGVSYLYVDTFLLNYPMVANKRFEKEFVNCGIKYTVENVPLDTGSPNSPQYSSLIIRPQNLTITNFAYQQPYPFFAGDQTYSLLYAIAIKH